MAEPVIPFHVSGHDAAELHWWHRYSEIAKAHAALKEMVHFDRRIAEAAEEYLRCDDAGYEMTDPALALRGAVQAKRDYLAAEAERKALNGKGEGR